MGISMPTFWLGLLLIYIFFFILDIAPPPMGRLSAEVTAPPVVTGLLLMIPFSTGISPLFSALFISSSSRQ